ncbi:MAG: DNA repair ATPase [Acidobacteriota bacterium]
MSDDNLTSASSSEAATTAAPRIEQATYDILRGRLEAHATTLRGRAEALNAQRLEVFGGTELAVIGNERIRTANNCVPRDIQSVGDLLLFGYNVFLGLRTETKVEDVLSLHTFAAGDAGFVFDAVAADDPRNFLVDPDFVRDFEELYRYYKEARLLQLRQIEDGKLLAVFQIGGADDDLRVFRWAIDADGRATYLDNRGERDHTMPPSHDFEWIETTRDDHVLGRHPHVSIRDEVFVETVGGDLTVKVEDNTEDGLGIYREDVDEPHQSLADAKILYARVGPLFLLRILPYNEQTWRHLVFNTRTRTVDRIDAIGQACQMLPEDHGIIFPGGYYLQDGSARTFEGDVADMQFKRVVRSPNGEDVLYLFYARRDGRLILLNYNLIRKEVQNPIHCHGMSLFDDGRLVLFRSTSDEPTRVHPMQIWQTPFQSAEHAASAPSSGSFLEKVGNAELVRGISDALSIHRATTERPPSVAGYEDLIAHVERVADAYYWLGHEAVGDLAAPLGEVRKTADRIVGEFVKIEEVRRRAREAVAESETRVEQLFHRLRSEPRDAVDHYVNALADLRRERGRLMTLREQREIDLEKIEALDASLVERFDRLSSDAVDFLVGDAALEPYHLDIEAQTARADAVETTPEIAPVGERLEEISNGLELLTEVVGSLEVDDPIRRTTILENISEVLSALNRGRAVVEARRKELLQGEGRAEFGAQFRLLDQSVAGALALADTPERCDTQLAKLMLQLEELESRFGEFDDFLAQLATKREDVYEAFASKKQTLVDARQRRAGRMVEAATRILDGVRRRASALPDLDALHTYFVGDAMVGKVRSLVDELRDLGESVRADEIISRLETARAEATRALRDRQDLFEEGAEVIQLGRHRFSVHTQAFDLTMVPRAPQTGGAGGEEEVEMAFHLTGTDFYEPVRDPAFEETQPFWNQLLVSEDPTVYRAEFLAASILQDAERGRHGLSIDGLLAATREADGATKEEKERTTGLLRIVRSVASERYDEGYERGVHDHDAVLVLDRLLALSVTAGLLRYAPRPRALACLFWAFVPDQTLRARWTRRSRSLARLRETFAHSPAIERLADEIAEGLGTFLHAQDLTATAAERRAAARYLFEELSRHPTSFTTSAGAETLRAAFLEHLDRQQKRRDFDEDLRGLEDDLPQRYRLAAAWLRAFVEHHRDDTAISRLEPNLDEAIVLLLTGAHLDRTTSSALPSQAVNGLLGQHPRLRDRQMTLRLDEFLARLDRFRHEQVPGFRSFQRQRHRLLEEERERLRLDEYRPQVMSAFVRNRLISEVYLPLIGDNLAKQMGTVGEGKRTDQMGLLLLISPPGYGKTTLMEYVANRLGLVFVKVNGPALGHGVTSLDPAQAPNLTARQEVEKINFAFEMSNNVLLYLDDIQHTHPELLQKFISLCDAQRRVEGVWNGRTRTYDMKGKRFAVCMAGNPYTESGEAFSIPDMLANRADTYNLGDILEGRDRLFALSYIENSLTSNPALSPLAGRDAADVEKLVAMARGDGGQADQLSHGYSSVELEDILAVLRRMLRVQEVVLAVNQQYIASAAQEDAFRTEPRFQLQGSYRNMNKMAEKIVAVMNDAELEAMIDDHYAGEAQTLTTGAESNLLKLAELRGSMTEEQAARWTEIKRGFARVQAMGGAEDDPAVRLIGQLGLVGDRLADIDTAIQGASTHSDANALDPDAQPPGAQLAAALGPYLQHLREAIEAMRDRAVQVDLGGRAESTPATVDLLPAVEGLGRRLEAAIVSLGTQVAQPSTPGPVQPSSTSASTEFAPYLDRLDATLQGLAASRPATVVQTLTPGVLDIFDRLAESVDDDLLPAVRILDKVRKHQAAEDRGLERHLERTLHHLDSLRDLVLSLRRLDTTSLSTGSAPAD